MRVPFAAIDGCDENKELLSLVMETVKVCPPSSCEAPLVGEKKLGIVTVGASSSIGGTGNRLAFG